MISFTRNDDILPLFVCLVSFNFICHTSGSFLEVDQLWYVLFLGGPARSAFQERVMVFGHSSPLGPLTGQPQRNRARFLQVLPCMNAAIQDMRVRRRSPLIKVSDSHSVANSDAFPILQLLQIYRTSTMVRGPVDGWDFSHDLMITPSNERCLVPKVGARVTWRTTKVSMNSISGVSRGGHWLMCYAPPPPSLGSPDILHWLVVRRQYSL